MENNCRLIDASAVLKHFDGYGFGQECDAEIILDYITEGAPTVDAIEVVRCKDCKHFVSPQGVPCCDEFMGLGFPNPSGDDFCSYGERRGQK